MTQRRARPRDEASERPHLTVVVDEVADERGGAFYARRGDLAAIVISPKLAGADYDCALGHELIHDEIGVVRPPATSATIEHTEAVVRRLTAEWMVPGDQLARLVARREDWEPITAALVAEEFDVTVDVAQRALDLLAAQHAS